MISFSSIQACHPTQNEQEKLCIEVYRPECICIDLLLIFINIYICMLARRTHMLRPYLVRDPPEHESQGNVTPRPAWTGRTPDPALSAGPPRKRVGGTSQQPSGAETRRTRVWNVAMDRVERVDSLLSDGHRDWSRHGAIRRWRGRCRVRGLRRCEVRSRWRGSDGARSMRMHCRPRLRFWKLFGSCWRASRA